MVQLDLKNQSPIIQRDEMREADQLEKPAKVENDDIIAAPPSIECKKGAILKLWESFSGTPTVNAMMLSANAQDMDISDRTDILTSLPDLNGKSVLEVGAGIGRFTSELAKTAKLVIAADFIESFIAENRAQHEALGNVKFLTGDAISIRQETESLDFVFTNWLHMYLPDEEVAIFLGNVLSWLKVDGHMHIRESCSQSSTQNRLKAASACDDNPTFYRHPSTYLHLLECLRWVHPKTGQIYRFEIQWAKSVETYIRLKQNWRQMHLLVKKIMVENKMGVPDSTSILSTMQVASGHHCDIECAVNIQQKVFNGHFSNVDRCLTKYLADMESKFESVLNFACPVVSPFQLAENLDAPVLTVTSDKSVYSSLLGFGNSNADQRIRFEFANFDLPDIKLMSTTGKFDLIIALDLFFDTKQLTVLAKNIKQYLQGNGKIILLTSSFNTNRLLEFESLGIKVKKSETFSIDSSPANIRDKILVYKKYISLLLCEQLIIYELESVEI